MQKIALYGDASNYASAPPLSQALSAADVVRALGGRKGRARCPVHAGKSMSLSLSDGADGRLLWHCFGGCDPLAVRDALVARGLLEPRPGPIRRQHPRRPTAIPPPSLRWSATAESMWRSTKPLTDTVAETYLRARRCWVADVHDLRFGAYEAASGRRVPAVVARITDAESGEPVSLHFTLLEPDGSKLARLYLAEHQKKRGVVRLVADEEVTTAIGIGEGIETCLSVLVDGWRPMWAALDAGNITDFSLVDGIETLTVFADRDDTGLKAAAVCAERWTAAGRNVRVVAPTRPKDWNDFQPVGPRERADARWADPFRPMTRRAA